MPAASRVVVRLDVLMVVVALGPAFWLSAHLCGRCVFMSILKGVGDDWIGVLEAAVVFME